jgi:hypothetical protein
MPLISDAVALDVAVTGNTKKLNGFPMALQNDLQYKRQHLTT